MKQNDKLLTFREVHALIGSTCKTGAYARQLAARGLIKCVRLNDRTLRYTESSVQDLINAKSETIDSSVFKLCAEIENYAFALHANLDKKKMRMVWERVLITLNKVNPSACESEEVKGLYL